MKHFTTALLLIILITSSLSGLKAQQAVTITANAEVLQSFTIPPSGTTVNGTVNFQTSNSMNFGKLQATSGQVVLNPLGANSNAGANASLARIAVTGAPNGQSLAITWDENLELSDDQNPTASKLSVTPIIAGSNSASQSSAQLLSNGSIKTAGPGGNADAGKYYLWIGGSLPELSSQATGNYTGTFNIGIAYN